MFYGNPKSKIVHYQQCHYMSHRRTSEVVVFHTMREANMQGYRLCRCCSPLGSRAHLKSRETRDFCRRNGIALQMEGERLKVRSQCGRWYIDLNLRNKLVLHHRNTRGDLGGYHIQDYSSNSVQGMLHYIVNHDRFRIKNPLPEDKPQHLPEPPRKGTRGYRKEKKKYAKKRRRYEVWRVRQLIDDLVWA